MELCAAPARAAPHTGPESIELESMTGAEYLDLYRRVGGPLRWDSRLSLPAGELEALLARGSLHVYVLRGDVLRGDVVQANGGPCRARRGPAWGICEFERRTFPEIELKHFGLVPEAQGRGLGPWLLSTALGREWEMGATRIWLHTDTWDHPAAVPVYRRAGFRVYDRRYQAAEGL
jgi:GNAT superfamily N-acetyltransferase